MLKSTSEKSELKLEFEIHQNRGAQAVLYSSLHRGETDRRPWVFALQWSTENDIANTLSIKPAAEIPTSVNVCILLSWH